MIAVAFASPKNHLTSYDYQYDLESVNSNMSVEIAEDILDLLTNIENFARKIRLFIKKIITEIKKTFGPGR
jgi:hypothetical protein